MDQQVSIGRIVLFGLGTRDGVVVERPAMVVQVWDGEPNVQLQVFTDADNDEPYLNVDERTTRDGGRKQARCVVWRTSVMPVDAPLVAQEGRWRWPPRV